MELNSEQFTQYKRLLLKTLAAFESFCNRYDLKYFAAGGTMLGAVRHHGFIPWDDDIDLYMLREDYDKLLQKKNELPQGYRLHSMEDEGFYVPFSKFIDENTTLWETKEVPYVIGVFLDIFPLDNSPSDLKTAKIMRKKYQIYYWDIKRSERKYTFKKIYNDFVNYRSFKLLFHSLYAKLYLSNHKDKVKARFQKLKQKIITYPKSDKLICYDGQYQDKEIMMREWFSKIIRIPFENLYINVPSGYNEYLTQMYGNYMKLPPLEKRIMPHGHYFFNLERKMSLDEIKELVEINIDYK